MPTHARNTRPCVPTHAHMQTRMHARMQPPPAALRLTPHPPYLPPNPPLPLQHFNAIRLPFSAELALDMDGKRPGNIDYYSNPELKGLTTGQVMDV